MHAHAGARKAIVIGRCSRVTQEKTLFQGQVITRKSPCYRTGGEFESYAMRRGPARQRLPPILPPALDGNGSGNLELASMKSRSADLYAKESVESKLGLNAS